jgi:hypothetical protein
MKRAMLIAGALSVAALGCLEPETFEAEGMRLNDAAAQCVTDLNAVLRIKDDRARADAFKRTYSRCTPIAQANEAHIARAKALHAVGASGQPSPARR